MRKQLFRAPAGRQSLAELLALAWPEATGEQVASAIALGQITVDGEILHDSNHTPPPGAKLVIVGTPKGKATTFIPTKEDLKGFDPAFTQVPSSEDGPQDFWDLSAQTKDVDLLAEYDSAWGDGNNDDFFDSNDWDEAGDFDVSDAELAAAEAGLGASSDGADEAIPVLPPSTSAHAALEPMPQIYMQGDGFLVVEKPVGPVDSPLGVSARTLKDWARHLGMEEGRLLPAIDLDWAITGPWLLATDKESLERIQSHLKTEEGTLSFRAVTPRLLPTSGHLKGRDKSKLKATYETLEKNAEFADLRIAFEAGRLRDLRLALAKLGAAILGDGTQGGLLVGDGLRLRVHALKVEALAIDVEGEHPESWMPADGLLPPRSGKSTPELVVSDATLKALKRGHQWCLVDAETGDYRRYRPGTLVRLTDMQGRRGPAAVIDGQGEIAARVWGHRASFDALATRFGIAYKQRARFFAHDSKTNAFRLIHGEADGFPGIYVDVLDKVLRATITSRACEGYLGRLYTLLKEKFPTYTLLEWVHISDLRSAEQQATRRVFGPELEDSRIIVEEHGLKYYVDVMGGSSTGFYPDQRANRERVLSIAKKGQRWLNLFCHTGAFTAALMKKGVDVVSVDASSRYLRWLEENLALNGLDSQKHQVIKKDARDALKQMEMPFHGIILDPPTAASGKRFWSSRSHYKQLVDQIIPLMGPKSYLLACRNDKKRKPGLKGLLERSVESEELGWASIEVAEAGRDYPAVNGFPEGDAFEGLLAQRGVAVWHPLEGVEMPTHKPAPKKKKRSKGRSKGRRR